MRNKLLFFIILSAFHASTLNAQNTAMPRLAKQGKFVRLMVDNKPYLILGGELGNSSASSTAYMKPIWPKLKKMNLNTVIAPVYWEQIEPKEGQFNFTLVDDLIRDARANQMKLVLLWFGSWKNSMSCYAPGWVKTNNARFPKIMDKKGISQEILSPFSKNNLHADEKAFVKLMQHIKQTDGSQHTVITVQVENEIGMLPDARSYDDASNAAFNQAVPNQLINYLQKNKDSLLPELKAIWERNGYKASGNWEEVFGKGLATDEIFAAWNFATYVNTITIAGKAIYNLPMYLNAALNRPNAKPGNYPSGGPLPHIMDIWKAGAPAIDIFAPDFYNPDFKHWCDLYTRTTANPLFIPEIKFEAGDDAKAFFAFGNYNCLSFSPFSIESTRTPAKEPIGKAYNILNQLTPLITKYGATGTVKGVLLDRDSVSKFTLGNYVLTVKHEYSMGWSAGAKDKIWPTAGGIIIEVAPGEYYVAGTGIIVSFEPVESGKRAGMLTVDEGVFKNNVWTPGRRMNGDQDHQGRLIRIAGTEYGIQHVKVYTY